MCVLMFRRRGVRRKGWRRGLACHSSQRAMHALVLCAKPTEWMCNTYRARNIACTASPQVHAQGAEVLRRNGVISSMTHLVENMSHAFPFKHANRVIHPSARCYNVIPWAQSAGLSRPGQAWTFLRCILLLTCNAYSFGHMDVPISLHSKTGCSRVVSPKCLEDSYSVLSVHRGKFGCLTRFGHPCCLESVAPNKKGKVG